MSGGLAWIKVKTNISRTWIRASSATSIILNSIGSVDSPMAQNNEAAKRALSPGGVVHLITQEHEDGPPGIRHRPFGIAGVLKHRKAAR
jgi:hypothetical protein